ncbi:MAG: Trm112 family protein [Thalassobaculaceae bacterium]|nr:Trm112 family protein [Thalassobaculaceae bacterium]
MPATETPGSATGPDAAGIDPKLLEILVCPVTKQALTYDRMAQELVSEKAGLAFPIREGVPIMLVEEARRLDEDPAGVASQGSEGIAS